MDNFPAKLLGSRLFLIDFPEKLENMKENALVPGEEAVYRKRALFNGVLPPFSHFSLHFKSRNGLNMLESIVNRENWRKTPKTNEKMEKNGNLMMERAYRLYFPVLG